MDGVNKGGARGQGASTSGDGADPGRLETAGPGPAVVTAATQTDSPPNQTPSPPAPPAGTGPDAQTAGTRRQGHIPPNSFATVAGEIIDPDALRLEIKRQQIDGLLRAGRLPLIANLVIAAGVTAFLWGSNIGNAAILLWLCIYGIIIGVRLAAFKSPTDTSEPGVDAWLRNFAGGSTITGAWLALLGLGLFAGLEPLDFILVVVVIAGLSAGAAASYAFHAKAAYGFYIPPLLVIAVYFFAQGDLQSIVMGAIALTYGGVLTKVVRGMGEWHRETVRATVQARQATDELRIIAEHAHSMENWIGPGGRLRWASPSAERLTGYTPEELTAMPDYPMPIVHPDDQIRMKRAFAAAQSSESERETIFRLRRKDGTLGWAAAVSTPAIAASGARTGFRASVRDITETRQLQEELRQANNNLGIITDYSYAWEVWSGPDGRIRWISPSVERITGYTAEECMAMDDYPYPFVHEADKETVRENFENPERKTQQRRWEFRVRRKDGGVRWCMVDSQPAYDKEGNYAGVRASLSDITEIKDLQEELRESAENLSTIANHSFAWEIWFSPEGKTLWVNPTVERLTGYTVDEFMALDDPLSLIIEEDRSRARGNFRDREHDESKREYECRIRRKDGEIRWVQVQSTPAFGADGSPLGFRSSVRDITELKELQDDLNEAHANLKIVTDYSQALELWFDKDLKLKWVSPSVERITGYKPKACYEIENFPVPTIHPEDRDKIARGLKAALHRESKEELEFRQIRRDGSVVWCSVMSRPAFDAEGNPVGFRASVRDISRQKALQKELEKMATTDPLTGICNRRQFFTLGETEVYRSARYEHNLTVAMLDVDHFKKINDTHGHHIGDECLKALSRCITSTIRRSDIFGRLGGEEFAILMPDTLLKDAAMLADRLRLEIQKINVPLSAGMCRFTVSIGVAGFRKEHGDLDQLLHVADRALYRAKEAGRNRVMVDEGSGDPVGPGLMAAE